MFDHLFLDKTVSDFRIVRNVENFFPQKKLQIVEDFREISALIDERNLKSRVVSGKKILYLNNYRGEVIKFCPARSPECYLCCNLHTINLMSNCIYNCMYCILQSCLTNPVMQVHCNLDQIFQALLEYDKSIDYPVRICTGEIADSLAMDSIVLQAPILIDFFKRTKNLYLELKTKSANVSHLLSLDSDKRTIVSFSLSPQKIAKAIELGTASLEERLTAARLLINNGYQVAFNFDPVLYYPGWQEEWDEFFTGIKTLFDPSEISWIHVGILRYSPGLDTVARQRFGSFALFDQEFIQGPDRKYRYPMPVRDEMYQFVFERINAWDKGIPMFTCTEQASHWKKFYKNPPKTILDVNERVMRRVVSF